MSTRRNGFVLAVAAGVAAVGCLLPWLKFGPVGVAAVDGGWRGLLVLGLFSAAGALGVPMAMGKIAGKRGVVPALATSSIASALALYAMVRIMDGVNVFDDQAASTPSTGDESLDEFGAAIAQGISELLNVHAGYGVFVTVAAGLVAVAMSIALLRSGPDAVTPVGAPEIGAGSLEHEGALSPIPHTPDLAKASAKRPGRTRTTVALAVVLLLGGGAAAIYFGVIRDTGLKAGEYAKTGPVTPLEVAREIGCEDSFEAGEAIAEAQNVGSCVVQNDTIAFATFDSNQGRDNFADQARATGRIVGEIDYATFFSSAEHNATVKAIALRLGAVVA